MRSRWLVAVAVSGALLVLPASPAEAHTVGGVGATNFRTSLVRVAPSVPGVELTVVENGSSLEVRNTTATPVIVRGYQNEPYARVGPEGVYVNQDSPATYLNANRFGVITVPSRADPAKPPVWRKVGSRPVFRWHDHRTHWMQTALPPRVSAAPGEYHQISRWTVTLDYGGTAITGHGVLAWVPGPSPWGLLALTALLLLAPGALVLLARRGRLAYAALAVGVLLVVAADATHSVGVALLAYRPLEQPADFFVPLVPQFLVWLLGLLAAFLLLRRREGGAWAAAIVGVSATAASGVPDLSELWRSSAPTVLSLALDRIAVVVALGVGLGLVVGLGVLLYARPPTTARWSASRPPADHAPDGPEPDDPEPDDGEPDDGEDEASTVPIAARRAVRAGVPRRELVGYAVVGGLGGLAGAGLVAAGLSGDENPPSPSTVAPMSAVGARVVPFYGARQAGIATPEQRQAHARIAAFDLLPGVRKAGLRNLLRRWTTAAAALTAGRQSGGPTDNMTAGSGPAGLTVTVGFGPSLFGKADLDRSARPSALSPLPEFHGEKLDPTRSEGDLGVLVCADDALVAFHALRTLERLASGVARPRWQQTGFARGPGVATSDDSTVRNLMGQLDGTRNPKPTDVGFNQTVFVEDPAAPDWLRGGSYLVVRRIRMLLDAWDALGLVDQEQVIGRRKESGGPLSGGTEATPANFGRKGSDGALLIPADAHMRLANSAFNEGATILRRGYSYTDGAEAGLIFLAWQADPRRGFIPIQRRLVAGDRLSRFIRHEASALFAMPAGVVSGGYLGQGLLE